MKKKALYIICALATAALLPSCEMSILDQESPSTFDESTVFANAGLAEGTLYGVAQAFGETNSYRGRFLPWYGFNTDIEWYNGFGATSKAMDNKNEIASYGITSNNTQMNLSNGPYNMMYTAIERANLIIEGVRTWGDLESDADLRHILGEALTLRAMVYYDLIKAWGDVPARFTPVSVEEMYVGKSSRDVIFSRILSDLEEAIGYLYLPGESNYTATTTRINRLFAEGLYARIALCAAGYALRPDDGCVGTGDAGTVRLSTDPEMSADKLYPKALGYLKDAISSGKASLVSDYETLWKNFNNLDIAAGGEILYSIPFSNGRGRWNYTFAVKNEGATINGVAFSQGGVVGPTPGFWFKYGDNDTRRDITCANYSWEKTGSITPSGIAKWYFGKFRFDQMESSPYGGGNDDGIKPVVMRYSDILLMAAEIENQLNGPTADAKDWLLQVRSRAYKGHESEAEEYVSGLTSKEDFFNAIVDERALEFCGEFLRKGDLIRWNMLKSKLDEAKQDMYDLRDKKGDFAYLSGNIYWQNGSGSIPVLIYGLGRNEQDVPEGDWELIENYVKYDDAKKSDLFEAKIENIYLNNPEEYMFWPIFDNTVDNSQGYIVNDYAYSK
ncbi:MAG: RagB/SusD family nutrient uptake outer membrane protein [Candidatus Cryptobacteroides sp.]